MEIRPMTDSDLGTVLNIERASFSSPWSRTSFLSLLRRDDAELWVAAVDGEVRGYAVVWYLADEAELGNLAVDPDWRRRGVGAELLEWSVARIRERGVRRIFLEVRPSNRAAQALYERYGFIPTGVRRRYYRSPVEDARVMCLELDSSGESRGSDGLR
jgi:ribosomal-protein-alanine N-acetyltransferase